MLTYLQILTTLVLLAWLMVYWLEFFFLQESEKFVEASESSFRKFFYSLLGYRELVKWVLNISLFVVYSAFVFFYYLERKTTLTWLFDSREMFMSLAWFFLLLFVLRERKGQLTWGFFFTPMITFLVFLGLTMLHAPELISITSYENFEEVQLWKNVFLLFVLMAKVFYFYAMLLNVLHHRLYQEIKYHLPRFFTSRLPSINKVDKAISTYLAWGAAVSVFVLMVQIKEGLEFSEVLFIPKLLISCLVLLVFVSTWWVRRKKYLTITLNLIVMVCGLFIQLFHLSYL